MVGTGTSGAAYRAVLDTPFEPLADGPAEEPILPRGISADQSAQLQNVVAVYRRQLQTRALQAASDHPGGLIVIARALVSTIAYEPLESPAGATIGIRLRYSIQFPSRQTLVAVPNVFPSYSEAAWRGAVEMKPLDGTITPPPQMVGVQSLRDVIVYRASATFEPDISYAFIVDFVPDYVFQGTLTGRFCLYEEMVSSRAIWQAIIADQVPVPYTISNSDTDSFATIPFFFPQRTFYQGFASDGAIDCGPVPNTRF